MLVEPSGSHHEYKCGLQPHIAPPGFEPGPQPISRAHFQITGKDLNDFARPKGCIHSLQILDLNLTARRRGYFPHLNLVKMPRIIKTNPF